MAGRNGREYLYFLGRHVRPHRGLPLFWEGEEADFILDALGDLLDDYEDVKSQLGILCDALNAGPMSVWPYEMVNDVLRKQAGGDDG
jgi:hypothetical protein